MSDQPRQSDGECDTCHAEFWSGGAQREPLYDGSRGMDTCTECFAALVPSDEEVARRLGLKAAATKTERPSTHLSPGALYHLQDDPDSTGIPGGNG